MNCRRCTTQIPSRSSSCPNCGQHVGAGESFIDDPGDSGVEGVSADDDVMGTSLVDAQSAVENVADETAEDEEEDELSLDDAVVSPEVAPPPKAPVKAVASMPGSYRTGRAAKSEPRPGTSHVESKHSGRSTLSKPVRPMPAKPAPKPSPATGPSSSLPFDTDTVRTLLAEQPELIEPGLEVLVDDAGLEIGHRHSTDVGVIDLLARDGSGDLVAVMVHGPDAGAAIVAEALQLVGWVRKHLAKKGEAVRGIVLCEGLDEDAAYTAAAVSGTIAFKSYALSLSVSDLDV